MYQIYPFGIQLPSEDRVINFQMYLQIQLQKCHFILYENDLKIGIIQNQKKVQMHCIQSQSQSTQDCLFNPKSPPSNNNLSSPHAFASNSTEKIKSIYSSRIFQQLIERLHEIGCKNKNQESIEQLMMNRFQSRGDETENQMTKILQDCLQFCVQQYHAKQQHLQIILEIATHFQHFIQAQSETITEQQSKIQFLQQQSHYRWVQCTQLHSCIDELEKQIQNMKNKSQNIIIQYQTEKYHLNHTNQAIKEVLRQTYESDREELSEVVKELQQELRSRTKKVKDMQNEVSQFHDQIMKKDKSIEQLKQENKDLKQQIRALQMNIQNLQQTKNKKQKQQFSTEKSKGQKLESQHFEKIKPEVKEAYSSSKLSDYIENIALPVTVAKKQEEICDSLPRERLRKMNSKSAGKNKEKNIEDIGAQKVIQDDYEQIHRDKDKNINKVSDKMNKNIKKMKSLALQPELQYICEPLELEDELTNNFHMPCSLVTKETQNEIEKQQRDEKYKSNTILERCLYKVKSIQRFSQVSEVGRFSNSLHFNLGELQRECESKLQPKSTNKVRKISIGLNTEPNQEQQFALEGLNSPSSPYKSKYNLLTSRSYQSHTGFNHPFTFDGNIQPITDQSSSKNMNTKIKQIVTKLVSRRTHKKKEAQSIAQIEKRRKNERQARQKLSKSFVGAIQNIKDSLVGPEKNSLKLPKQDKIPFSSPNLIKKPSHRKNLSTSMIDFSYPTKSRVSENTVPEPERNMKKGKNVSSILQIKQQGPQRKQEQKHQNKGGPSSIFSSIFDFAVKNRIKKN